MTREIAINRIREIERCTPIHTEDDVKDCKALEMAIQALSQEPCTVSVSEKEPNEITEEVTLRFFKNSLKVRWHDFVIYNVEWLKKNWQMEMDIVCGVKPCDDAVSREAVKQAINCWIGSGEYRYAMSERFLIDRINDLLSVTQKPIECDDAISREAAITIAGTHTLTVDETVKALERLPSVTHKSGKWILLDECANSGYYCSECQKKLVKEGWSNTVKKINYCPNCGAKMESEDEK